MPPELDTLGAGQEPQGSEVIGLQGDESDREGAMAKADLFKLANYAHKLFQQIDDDDQLEAWVQAKITKAADYIASVYHYLEYEMKFSEYGKALDNSDVLSEGQKQVLKNKLMEAKAKVKELKKAQAEKTNKKVDEEKSSTGGEITHFKGGLRHKHNPDRFTDEPHGEPESHAKAKSSAEKAGEKAADKAEVKQGKDWEKRFGKGSVTRVKDGKKVDEALKGGQKKLDTDNDDDIDAKDLANLRAKKKVKENSAEEKADADYDKDGRVETGKAEYLGSKIRAAKKAGKLKEGQKCTECGLMMEKCSCEKVEESAKCNHTAKGKKCPVHGLKECGGMYEASKPSAGLSKKEKSAVVKKAKKGGDIGKPGKKFDDVAKEAGGGKKGKAIAAAAMWKNVKRESIEALEQAPVATKKPTTQAPQDVDGSTAPPPKGPDGQYPIVTSGPNKGKRWSPQTPGPTNPAVKESITESQDFDRIKELTQRLLG